MTPLEITMYVLGVDEVTARFILAIEAGEVTSDVIDVSGDQPEEGTE